MTARPEDNSIDDFPSVLRARVVGLLKAMNTLAGPYVDSTRVPPLTGADQPRIIVYAPNRHYQNKGYGPPQFEATGKVIVVGYVSGADTTDVETRTEQLGTQILALMTNIGFTAPPVERVVAIDVKFEMVGDSDRYEGYATAEFDIAWTEVFEIAVAPFTGTSTYDWAAGAPLQEIVLSEVPFGTIGTDGTVGGGPTIAATISLSGTL
jgi:hypothetical protein